MKEYAPIKVKIPHPWWHRFFLDLISWGDDGSYENYYCSKCDKRYVLRARVVDAVEVPHD